MTKRRAVLAAVVLMITALIGGGVLLTAAGTQPLTRQPLAFSHQMHATDNQIPCLYCHGNARRSAVAGVPALQRCMGCHRGLKIDDTPDIQKLKAHWQRQEPIRWVRVFDQPDFVRFSHKRHVQQGIACQKCHGPVQTMTQVRDTVRLNMDRCIDCHLERRASIDCLTCHK